MSKNFAYLAVKERRTSIKWSWLIKTIGMIIIVTRTGHIITQLHSLQTIKLSGSLLKSYFWEIFSLLWETWDLLETIKYWLIQIRNHTLERPGVSVSLRLGLVEKFAFIYDEHTLDYCLKIRIKKEAQD